MKIEDIENTVPLAQVKDNEDHNNEKPKANRNFFWKLPRKISILALTILVVFIIVVIGCCVLHFTLTNSKGKSQILSQMFSL